MELEIEMRNWNKREWESWRALEAMGRGRRQRARASVRETAKSRLKWEWENESAAESYAKESEDAGSYAGDLDWAFRDEQAGEESEAGEKACGVARLEEEEAIQAEDESESNEEDMRIIRKWVADCQEDLTAVERAVWKAADGDCPMMEAVWGGIEERLDRLECMSKGESESYAESESAAGDYAETKESKEEAEGRETLGEAEAWEVKQLKAAALEGIARADVFRLEKIAEEDMEWFREWVAGSYDELTAKERAMWKAADGDCRMMEAMWESIEERLDRPECVSKGESESYTESESAAGAYAEKMNAADRGCKEEAEGCKELSVAETWEMERLKALLGWRKLLQKMLKKSESAAGEVKQLKAAALEAAAGDRCSDVFRLQKITEEGAGEQDAGVRQCTDTKGGCEEEVRSEGKEEARDIGEVEKCKGCGHFSRHFTDGPGDWSLGEMAREAAHCYVCDSGYFKHRYREFAVLSEKQQAEWHAEEEKAKVLREEAEERERTFKRREKQQRREYEDWERRERRYQGSTKRGQRGGGTPQSMALAWALREEAMAKEGLQGESHKEEGPIVVRPVRCKGGVVS